MLVEFDYDLPNVKVVGTGVFIVIDPTVPLYLELIEPDPTSGVQGLPEAGDWLTGLRLTGTIVGGTFVHGGHCSRRGSAQSAILRQPRRLRWVTTGTDNESDRKASPVALFVSPTVRQLELRSRSAAMRVHAERTLVNLRA